MESWYDYTGWLECIFGPVIAGLRPFWAADDLIWIANEPVMWEEGRTSKGGGERKRVKGDESRGRENFHDDMNMSAIITWSMEFIATIIFFTYDQRHFIAMIQNILPWTTVFHSYAHHFHTWSGVIHSYEYYFIAWRVMNSDHERLLFMRFIYEN